MDKLNLLKLYLSVVDQGSFAGAAVSLGLSPSTLSKAIARLEEDLQLHLFHRTTRQIKLTEAGHNYALKARRILTELEQCELDLQQSNKQPTGLLNINLPVSYGRLYVLPLLKEFHRQYPDIELKLSFDDAYVDIIEQGVDVCIRSGSLEPSSLIARQLSPIDFLICAAPGYLNSHKKICVSNYPQYPWIRFRFKQTGRLMPIMYKRHNRHLKANPSQEYIVDDGEALAELCAQGLGLTQMPHFIARDWLKRGEIVPIAPYYRSRDQGIWLIYAKRDYQPAKIQAFVNFLREKIQSLGETPRRTWVEDLEAARKI